MDINGKATILSAHAGAGAREPLKEPLQARCPSEPAAGAEVHAYTYEAPRGGAREIMPPVRLRAIAANLANRLPNPVAHPVASPVAHAL